MPTALCGIDNHCHRSIIFELHIHHGSKYAVLDSMGLIRLLHQIHQFAIQSLGLHQTLALGNSDVTCLFRGHRFREIWPPPFQTTVQSELTHHQNVASRFAHLHMIICSMNCIEKVSLKHRVARRCHRIWATIALPRFFDNYRNHKASDRSTHPRCQATASHMNSASSIVSVSFSPTRHSRPGPMLDTT